MENFSEREKNVIEIIGKKKLTLQEISASIFKKTPNKPFDSDISVANTIRRIIKKCEYYELNWTLVKSRFSNKLVISKGKRS